VPLAWVYIMTNAPSRTLYVGVTRASRRPRLAATRRPRVGVLPRMGLTRLVYVEEHASIIDAIAREKALKNWKRGWKLNLIGRVNPDWDDLWKTISM
jgi:putative endonuclease